MVITRYSITNLIKTTLFFIIALKCADEIGWQHVYLSEKYSFSAPTSSKFSENIIPD